MAAVISRTKAPAFEDETARRQYQAMVCRLTTHHESYPYAVRWVGFMQWRVYDVRTKNEGETYRSHPEAVIGCFRLKVRNLVNE